MGVLPPGSPLSLAPDPAAFQDPDSLSGVTEHLPALDGIDSNEEHPD